MAERVVKSGFHIYLQSIVFALGGGAYWLIFAALIGPHEMGKAALVITTSSLISTAARLGLDYAVMKTNAALHTPLKLYYAAAILPTAAASYLMHTQLGPLGAAATAAFIAANAGPITAASLIATYNTERLPTYAAASIAVRFTATLALLEHKWAAVATGYILGTATYTAATAISATRQKHAETARPADLMKFGLAAWPSQLYDILIASAGTATTYMRGGEDQAGVFYVAYTAATVAMGLPPAMATAALPHYATSDDKPQTIARITAMVGAPFLAAVIAAPSQTLSIIGKDYAVGGVDFAILSLALHLRAIANAYLNWNYAKGRLRVHAVAYAIASSTLLAISTSVSPSIAALTATTILLAPWKPRKELAHTTAILPGVVASYAISEWPLTSLVAFLTTTAITMIIASPKDKRVALTALMRAIRNDEINSKSGRA